jgi:2,3-bisphosphoglycerate-independent phosphoglycerate mutase
MATVAARRLNMSFAGKAAVVVLDGFGLHPETEWKIVSSVWERLDEEMQIDIKGLTGDRALAKGSLAPTSHGVARYLCDLDGSDWLELFSELRSLHDRVGVRLRERGRLEEVRELVCEVAAGFHYAPWAVSTPYLYSLRQEHPTWITRTAGVFTGQVEMNPEIMGNSDTGHQQIFNLAVARQIPAAISQLIDSGRFFTHEELNRDLMRAREGATVVVKTLLSGEYGDDGYVHSAWPHLVAFLKLYFEHLKLPAERLQIEAVLDGRDSPSYSSLRYEQIGGEFRYGFLRKLRRTLKQYGAQRCLTWIIGRQFMDRDYKGVLIRREYEMLTQNAGRRVGDLDQAFERIADDHGAGFTDPMVEPVIIGEPRPLGDNTVFFNLIFRADRQEPITAALIGDLPFIKRQAEQKRRVDTWEEFTWITPFDSLIMWGMIDYHLDFRRGGAKSIHHDQPHEHNVLALLTRARPDFHFLFLTEGVKEKHMGLFSRGRRSNPLVPAETQQIIPTYGAEDGVNSDNDLYKVPFMRHPEITEELVRHLERGTYDLVAANFPGADMIGHLVQHHFNACLETLKSLEASLQRVVPAARDNGWLLVVTSDHGNVEHYGPDHGNNDVLTSVVLPSRTLSNAPPGSSTRQFDRQGNPISAPRTTDESGALVPTAPAGYSARLFDISWTILEALGVAVEELEPPAWEPGAEEDPNRLIGQSLVKRA